MKLLIFFLSALTIIHSQTVKDFIVPEGNVYAVTGDSNTVYFTGEFNYIGPPAPFAAAIDLKTGNLDPSFPAFEALISKVISDGRGGYIVVSYTSPQQWMGRENLVYRMNGDYSINQNWVLKTNGLVYAVTVWNNIIIIGGEFSQVNGQARNQIAAVDLETGGLIDWGTGITISGDVFDLLINNDTLFIGGSFGSINGIPRQSLAAVLIKTGELINWNPTVSGPVTFLDMYNGCLVAAGYLKQVNGLPRKGIAFINMQNGHVTDWSIDMDPHY